jgi:hypothetical protein
VNPSEFSWWQQFLLDLIVAIAGSAVAIWGALWIFRRDLAEEERVRKDEDEKRRKEANAERLQRRDDEHEAGQRLLIAVLTEMKLNIRSIDYMSEHPPVMFPLRLDAYGLYMPHLQGLPDNVAESIQEAVMLIDRYNALNLHSEEYRLAAAKEARAALNRAGHEIADYFQPERAHPGATRTGWILDLRHGLDRRIAEDEELG